MTHNHNHNHTIATTTVDTVCAMEGVTVFCDVLKDRMLIPISTSEDDNKSATLSVDTDTDTISVTVGFNDESEEFTLFVPTVAAFAKISTAFEK